MVTEILIPHKLVACQKNPAAICSSAIDACKKVTAEIANLIIQKQTQGEQAVLGLATCCQISLPCQI